MKTRNFVFLVLALVMISCSKGGPASSVTPTIGGGTGSTPPNQSNYEPLGDAAPRHYLKDNNGSDTTMWVRLLWLQVPRGSTLVYGNQVCPDKCFQFQAEIGKDDMDPRRDATISFSLSEDCVNPLGGVLAGGTVVPGTSMQIGRNSFKFFDFTPKCLLAIGDHHKDGGGRVVGTYPLVLDYNPPR